MKPLLEVTNTVHVWVQSSAGGPCSALNRRASEYWIRLPRARGTRARGVGSRAGKSEKETMSYRERTVAEVLVLLVPRNQALEHTPCR